jgi:hypothetical protein
MIAILGHLDRQEHSEPGAKAGRQTKRPKVK